MMRWILGGVTVVCLAAIVHGAPQRQGSHQNLSATVSGSTGRVSVYKNGTRDNPDGNSELFGYPEDASVIDSKQNARNRTPVYIPNRCQRNEILYPGDQESDWVCDCKPTYVYHPPTRQCYQLFTQAYCNEGEMVELPVGAKHPRCVNNPCRKRNMVQFEGVCVQLNEYHIKCKHHDLEQIVSVREEDNTLGCINISDLNVKKTMVSTKEDEKQGNANRAARQSGSRQ